MTTTMRSRTSGQPLQFVCVASSSLSLAFVRVVSALRLHRLPLSLL